MIVRSIGNYGADQVCAVKVDWSLQNHRCGAEVRSVSGRASALVVYIAQHKKMMMQKVW